MSNNLIALQNKFLGHGETVYDKISQLYATQKYVGDDDLLKLATEFNLPPAHVRSTAKFYQTLRADQPPAKHCIKVCNGEACRAAGCDALGEELEQKLNTKINQPNNSQVQLEHVSCLGYCGLGPNAMIDELPVSLANEMAIKAAVDYTKNQTPHSLTEPTNAIHLPSKDKPCILLRHFKSNTHTITQAKAAGIYQSLEKAITQMTPKQVIEQVIASQLRGRGGAGFPAGIKLQTVASSEIIDGSGRRFVVVNFDEGDAGSYIDKELIEHDPHTQLEGILIAAYACGAAEAMIYARHEYPRATKILQTAIEQAREAGLIGKPLFGSDFSCEIRVVPGQGAYVCGEETSLLRSIEGLPALVSFKPPFPAQQGLWNCPTAVNNVETLHNLSWIIEHGGEAYAQFGYEKSRGTKAISLNHRVKKPGVYEVELGITLREIIFDLAGGMAKEQTFKAVQVGGPLGGILPESALDTPLDFEALAKVDGILGHAGIVVYSQNDDLMKIARGLMAFCAIESCGKCFPCRIGSVRGTELFDQMLTTGVTDQHLELLNDLCETMKFGSLCALGGMAPLPIQCLVQYFPDEIDRYRKEAVK